MGDSNMVDGMVKDGLWDTLHNKHMGVIAEEQATRMGLTREDMDGYSAVSYSRAARAVSNKSFKEIVGIDGVLTEDEEVQKVARIDKLPELKSAFSEVSFRIHTSVFLSGKLLCRKKSG